MVDGQRLAIWSRPFWRGRVSGGLASPTAEAIGHPLDVAWATKSPPRWWASLSLKLCSTQADKGTRARVMPRQNRMFV
jgi:hypothetical protein